MPRHIAVTTSGVRRDSALPFQPLAQVPPAVLSYVSFCPTMDSVEDTLLFYLMLKKKKRRVRERRWWVHPLLTTRGAKGLFHTLYDDIREYDEKFFMYFRMSKGSFDELSSKVEDTLKKEDTILRKAIPPDERLALFLRYVGAGNSMTDLHLTYRIGLSTVSTIIREVADALWTNLREECFPKLTTELLEKSASEFEERANFPHCVAAIDGKHIRLTKPPYSGSEFFNYKHFFSIILLAVVDSNYKFLFIDVGAKGKASDSTIYLDSVLRKKLVEKEIKLPDPRPLPGQVVNSPFIIVADEGFGLCTHLLRPYSGHYLTVKKKVFNYRLTRSRRFVECTFGILSNKWRILHRPMDVDLELAQLLTKVCCLLHNFVRDRDGFRFEDTLTIYGLEDMENTNVQVGRCVNTLRNNFADYFMSEEGQVPWQLSKI